MTAPQRFVATNFTLRVLIAAAYKLNPRAVLGGPSWIDSDHDDIVALVPDDPSAAPGVNRHLTMLRHLLAFRFGFVFHRDEKDLPLYLLSVARNGPKLKETTAPPDRDPPIVNRVLAQFAAMLQRSVFNRPAIDKTGLTNRYDFDLEWTPDQSQFEGLFRENPEPTKPGLFTAIQQQLGLKLEASRGPVPSLAIDWIQRPTEN